MINAWKLFNLLNCLCRIVVYRFYFIIHPSILVCVMLYQILFLFFTKLNLMSIIRLTCDDAEVGERGFLVSPGFELCSGLNPMSSYNTPDVDALALHQRGCYMDSENILKFYSNYSVTRCMVECLTRQLIEKCSCRPYYYKGILNIVDNNLVCYCNCTDFFHSFIGTLQLQLLHSQAFRQSLRTRGLHLFEHSFWYVGYTSFRDIKNIHRAF